MVEYGEISGFGLWFDTKREVQNLFDWVTRYFEEKASKDAGIVIDLEQRGEGLGRLSVMIWVESEGLSVSVERVSEGYLQKLVEALYKQGYIFMIGGYDEDKIFPASYYVTSQIVLNGVLEVGRPKGTFNYRLLKELVNG